MSEGWIKLHRKFIKWEWYDDASVFRLFTHLLLTVNYEDKRWRGIEVKAGSIVTGIDSLVKQTGLGRQQIRTAIEKLVVTGEITRKTTSKYSIISILNWESYQGDNRQVNTQATLKQHSANTQLTATKEGNNIRKKEIVYTRSFLDIWAVFPKARRGNKENAQKAHNRALKRDTEENINIGVQAYIDSEEARRYPKGCAAWFNDDRWKNDYKGVEDAKRSDSSSEAQLSGWSKAHTGDA